jgi:hypothetical protein
MAGDMRRKIDIGHSVLSIRPDGIVQIDGSNHMYSHSDVLEIHKALGELRGDKRVLVLAVASEYTSLDPSARQYLSTPEAGIHSIAEAYVIHSLAQRMLMNFLTKVAGTPVPVHFFKKEQHAVDWLKSFEKGGNPVMENGKNTREKDRI